MPKSLQASVGEIDPALFFIALIVAFIFALYQSWSSDKPDNKGGLILEGVLQVILCQKHLFLDQLTHNMTKDCSMIYEFSTRKLQKQNMSRTCCLHKLFRCCKFKV